MFSGLGALFYHFVLITGGHLLFSFFFFGVPIAYFMDKVSENPNMVEVFAISRKDLFIVSFFFLFIFCFCGWLSFFFSLLPNNYHSAYLFFGTLSYLGFCFETVFLYRCLSFLQDKRLKK